MDCEDYKRGVKDALEWAHAEKLLHQFEPRYVEGKFWKERGGLTADERRQTFLQGADTYIAVLKDTMKEREINHPGGLHHDGPWIKAYMQYLHAMWAADRLERERREREGNA